MTAAVRSRRDVAEFCAARWAEAAGVAPPVVLEATEARALHTIPRHDLDARALRGVKP